ncbi:Nuclear import receptor [Entomophthora muscae]|uniref:Nuclear import receptor n=1 Tax=Entomophthora muscae TaxID=34485 RepID=A0ACC2TJQ9_9FUNG|nr:Nuclear import receptor [Entomophthora muscae]
MSYNLQDQVLSALAALYNPQPNQAQLIEATNFLEQFQKKVEAWSIADQLLRDPNQNTSVKFFMAQTLRQKIKHQLNDLDTGARFSLRDSLLSEIVCFKEGPKPILTQLCLGLASLVIQLVEWQNAVPQLIQEWSQDGAMCFVLLQLLTVLPQEVNSVVGFCSLTDEQFRSQATVVLTNNGGQLLPLLVQYMQGAGNNSQLQDKVFSCLISWLRSGDISIMDLKDSPLVEAAFDAITQQPALFDMATEIICSMIYETREVQSCMPVIKVLLPRLVKLYEYLRKGEHGDDTFQGLCRIFAEAGEAYLDLIIEHPQHFQPILDAIIDCVRLCPIRTIPVTFSFWYSFSYSLRAPEEAAMFIPFFQSTVRAIIGRLAYPMDDDDFTLEDEDSFRDFRHEIGDILKDCASVLGGNNALEIVLEGLQQWLQQQGTGAAPPWQKLEATLFSARALGSKVRPEDKTALRGIFELFPRLPVHDKVRYAATLVLCCYAEWTHYYPELLPFQLTYVAEGLNHPEVAPASAMALGHFGKHCGEFLVPHLPELNQIYATYLDRLRPRDLLDITTCIACVLPWVPRQVYLPTLQQYMDPILFRIQTLLPQIASGSSVIDDLSFNIDRLHSLFENGTVNVPDIPILPLVEKIWPLFDSILQHLVSHHDISEAVSRLFRCIIRIHAPISLAYQPTLSAAFLRAFEQSGLNCYMWVLSKFIEAYYPHEPQQAADILLRLCQSFFEWASRSPVLDEISQVVEEFSYTLMGILKIAKADFFTLQTLPTIIQFYRVALDMKEVHAVEATLFFIRNLLSTLLIETERPGKSPADFPVVGLIHQSGGEYISRLVANSLTSYPSDLVEDGGSAITLICELCPQSSIQWVSQAFLGLPNHPFSSPNDPSVPSLPLQSFLEQLNSYIDQNTWRPFNKTMIHFILRYRRQQAAEADKN